MGLGLHLLISFTLHNLIHSLSPIYFSLGLFFYSHRLPSYFPLNIFFSILFSILSFIPVFFSWLCTFCIHPLVLLANFSPSFFLLLFHFLQTIFCFSSFFYLIFHYFSIFILFLYHGFSSPDAPLTSCFSSHSSISLLPFFFSFWLP